MVRVAVTLFLLMFPLSPASAAKRVALVIGNGAYANVSTLINPARDASAVEMLLRAAGFDVVQVNTDLGVAAMRRALRDFSDHVRDSDIALLFYAGHGIEVNGTNYLIPVDAALERDIDVEDETISLDRAMQMLEPAKRLRLVILDACRANPFVRSMKRTVSTRSIGRGLAKVEILSSDTLVAFAAKAGATASDGGGANSPYTTALVKHLTTPDLDLRMALGRVRDEVLKSTSKKQEPFLYGSLGGDEVFLATTRRTQPHELARKQVLTTERFEILTQSSWNQQCVADPLPGVSTINGPKNGEITFGEGLSEITHVLGDNNKCLGKNVRSRFVYYVPSGAQVEIDEVSLAVVNARGERWHWDCTIRVQDRRADCRIRK